MAKGRQFEAIPIWQYSKKLAVKIFSSLKDNRNYSFRDQIQRASLSIMNNIAEGLERNGDKELRRFLIIAKGSCGEVRSMLHLAHELQILPKEICNEFREESTRLSQMLGGFIRSIQKNITAV